MPDEVSWFPPGWVFELPKKVFGRDRVQNTQTNVAAEYDGRPCIPAANRIDEQVVSYWSSPIAQLNQRDASGKPLEVRGKLDLILTTRAIRACFGSGTVPGNGDLHGGSGVVRATRVYAIRWPLQDIEEIEKGDDGTGRDLLGWSSKTREASMLLGVIHRAKDAYFTVGKLGLDKSRVGEFADALVAAAAKAHAQIPEHQQHAQAALRGEWVQDSEGISTMRFA